MAIFGAGHTFLTVHGLDARVPSMAAAGFGAKTRVMMSADLSPMLASRSS